LLKKFTLKKYLHRWDIQNGLMAYPWRYFLKINRVIKLEEKEIDELKNISDERIVLLEGPEK